MDGITRLKFIRPLDTCDQEGDVPITPDTLNLIWSFGETDEIGYHGPTNRGSSATNFLDPPMESPIENFETWTIQRTMVMPEKKTSYWCSIHKSPDSYTTTRHVIGVS